MHHPIRRRHILNQDPRRIDKQRPILPPNRDIRPLRRQERSRVPGGDQVRAELDLLAEDVVRQDAGELLLREGADRGANGFKGVVGRRKDGDVRQAVDAVGQAGRGEGAGEGGEACVDGCLGGIGGDGEDLVDDVDDAVVVEGDVLLLGLLGRGLVL